MPFQAVEYEHGALPRALAEYCSQNRISPTSEKCDDARQLLTMSEKQSRCTVADLKATLVAPIRAP
jgi:hypothetical protein